ASTALAVQPEVDTVSLSFDTTIQVREGADIVFVMDDSGSMGPFQQIMVDHIDQFVQQIESITNSNGVKTNFHLGVITTTVTSSITGGFGTVGSDGELVNGFVSTDDLLWQNTFKENLLVGDKGSFEENSYGAMSLLFSNKNNQNFRRPGSPLYFVIVTDEPTQVGLPLNDLLTVIDAQVPNRDFVSASSFTPVNTSNTCREGNSGGGDYNIKDFVDILGGTHYDLCNTNFGETTKQLGEDIYNLLQTTPEFVYVETLQIFGKVNFETLKVSFNGQDLVKGDKAFGFSFDPTTNKVHLGHSVDLSAAPQEQILVNYELM
ncbi:MAG: hypothetical protein HRT44_02185, partial [Bdellovibrionales bacterium]|nr:hypothetical protein [Bdellovibrionales bacterium]NQZ18055.1 hypothetical protein [Bdellovibrionales bacterium]